jgi:acyl-CoA synthetase (AMP-forming)/AMP-acid ligase II
LQAEVVALLAPSNLEYVVSVFALSRMGFAVLFLSNRLAQEAYVNLLKATNCTKIVASPSYSSIVQDIQSAYPLKCFDLEEQTYFTQQKTAPFPLQTYSNASDRIAFIVHSSGSTGLPKPIFQSHKACVSNYSSGIPYRAFLTLPLFHNHGISTLMRALCAGRQMSMYNANLPLAGSTLIEAMAATEPESLHCVPYALKLLAETSEGIEALKKCKLVLYGGSSCPDDLGDTLVAHGVYLVGHYGA